MTTIEQNKKDIAAWKNKMVELEAAFAAKPNKKTATALSNHRMDEVLPITKIKTTMQSLFVCNAVDLLLPKIK